MKKFMTIAMIVLAAAMLVVSCDANKKADVDHSVLVNATLGVSEGKELVSVLGTSDNGADIHALAVMIEPKWETLKGEELPYYGNMVKGAYTTKTDANGAALTGANLSVNLGYISQGLWDVYVKAYNKSNVLVYEGNGSFYFTNKSDTHTVVLNENAEGTVTFTFGEISTPAYIDGAEYSLEVTIDNVDGNGNEKTYYYFHDVNDDYVPLKTASDYSSAETYYTTDTNGYKKVENTTATDWNKYFVPNTSATDWTWTLDTKASELTTNTDAIAAGSHTYTVLLKDQKDGNVSEGGVTGRFFVTADDANPRIEGKLAKSDFEASTIKIVVDKISMAWVGSPEKKISYTTDADAKQTYKVSVTSTTGETIVESQITWWVDGVQQGTGYSYDFAKSSNPGYHHITAKYSNSRAGLPTVTVFVDPTGSNPEK